MQIRVLGCSGGIGGPKLRTTSLLVDEDILIDAGTGVADLSIDQLAKIDHVFLTHAHLDHIASIPFMVDTAGHLRDKPLIVHGREATLQALHAHIFNWSIWPDFTRIPSVDKPFLKFETHAVGDELKLGDRVIRTLPVNHVVPSQGFVLSSAKTGASCVFTGDTGKCEPLWDCIAQIDNLKAIIVETAFSDDERDLAERSLHLCPALLRDELDAYKLRLANKQVGEANWPEILITHLKPGESELIVSQLHMLVRDFHIRPLEQGETLTL